MKWSRKVPTADGLYWMRNRYGAAKCNLVRVFQPGEMSSPSRLVVISYVTAVDHDVGIDVTSDRYEWQPLQWPMDQREDAAGHDVCCDESLSSVVYSTPSAHPDVLGRLLAELYHAMAEQKDGDSHFGTLFLDHANKLLVELCNNV